VPEEAQGYTTYRNHISVELSHIFTLLG
jgi:hypothetical protein